MTTLGISKRSTRVEGFDQITEGGLPCDRTTLVMGGPGAGKTIAQEFVRDLNVETSVQEWDALLRELFINFSIVVTLTSIGAYIVSLKVGRITRWMKRIVVWAFLSGSSMILMVVPMRITQGTFLDLRAVPLFLSTFYGGPGWGLAAALPVALYRVYLGGGGMLSGVISILATPIVSGLLRKCRVSFDEPVARVARLSAMTFGIVLLDLWMVPTTDRYFFWRWYPLMVLSYTGAMALCSYLLRTWSLARGYLAKTETQALTDHLTGLPNARAFEQDLGEAFSGSLLLVDLDHFKWVNDTHGHQAGDLVLHDVAETIQRSVRTHDLVYRYGGEEFAVLFRDCPSETAMAIAERMRTGVAGCIFTLPTGETMRITISGGLAPLIPGALKAQFAVADKLLYRAKEAGGNRICAL